jgi:hypothetical protein
MGRISVIRRQQMMQGEIESLRRERVALRAALATVVSMGEVYEMRRHALKALVMVPAAPAWDGDAPAAEPDDWYEAARRRLLDAVADPPQPAGDAIMDAYRAAWAKTAKDH